MKDGVPYEEMYPAGPPGLDGVRRQSTIFCDLDRHTDQAERWPEADLHGVDPGRETPPRRLRLEALTDFALEKGSGRERPEAKQQRDRDSGEKPELNSGASHSQGPRMP